jgi:hypothetical protein
LKVGRPAAHRGGSPEVPNLGGTRPRGRERVFADREVFVTAVHTTYPVDGWESVVIA